MFSRSVTLHSFAGDSHLAVFALVHAQHHKSGIAWLDIRDYQSLSFPFSIYCLIGKQANLKRRRRRRSRRKTNWISLLLVGKKHCAHAFLRATAFYQICETYSSIIPRLLMNLDVISQSLWWQTAGLFEFAATESHTANAERCSINQG